MHVHTYIYIVSFVHWSIQNTCTCTCTYMLLYMYCNSTCTYVTKWLFMYVHVNVRYMYVYIRTYIYVHVRTYVYINMYNIHVRIFSVFGRPLVRYLSTWPPSVYVLYIIIPTYIHIIHCTSVCIYLCMYIYMYVRMCHSSDISVHCLPQYMYYMYRYIHVYMYI